MTIACGDSHTSTHGAFGSVAFGIGTSQVRDVLASQCLALEPLKVRRIRVNGTAAAWRLRQGRHPDDHPAARRQRRHRLRLRVRRRHHRPDDDGRADDDLQHVDRRRRAGRATSTRTRRRSTTCAAGRLRRPARRSIARSPGGASIASDPDAVYDDDGRHPRRGADAGGDLGRQPGPVDRRRRSHSRAVEGRRRSEGDHRRARLHGAARRAADCRA